MSMAKVLNAVFGIGIAVVLYIVVLLGIQAFYPDVRYDEFCNDTRDYDPVISFSKCQDNITVGECRASINDKEREIQKCEQEFENANRVYSQNFFLIASILGVLIISVAYLLMYIPHISAGVACSGIILLLWGFMRGWESTNNMVKFVVSLIIASVVISLAFIVNKKLTNK